MVFINYRKVISSITNGLIRYVSHLEDIKYQYNVSLQEYKKLNSLYENMNYNLEDFVKEYAKSSNSQKEYFISIVNEIYDGQRQVKALLNETRNEYLISIYSNDESFPMLKDFMNKLKDKCDSLSLMLNDERLKELDNKIEEYIDFSRIFDKDRIIGLYDTNKYIDIIDSLNIDADTKIQAMEMGIKEFNRLYNELLEEEYSSYNELSIDYTRDLDEDYLDDFSFDGVENE